jgi:hypothetical protein
VFVAHHLPKLCAHLVTALARLHVHNLARRSSLEAGSKREKNVKGGEGGRGTTTRSPNFHFSLAVSSSESPL